MRTKIKKLLKSILWHVLNGISPLFSEKSTLSSEGARGILEECSPRPSGVSCCSNEILPAEYDLQIIVPAYNAAAYLQECMDSILQQQTKYSFHIVLVNDGSVDDTGRIADSYAQDPRVTVIHQANKGFSGARNTALKQIRGTYITFVDSDDILCPGAIEALLDTAYAHGCDYVEGGMYEFDARHTEVIYRYEAAVPVSDGYSTFHGYACGKIFKSELWENLCLPSGFWYEDSVIAFLIWPKLSRGYTEPHMVYKYRQNQSGISASSHGKAKAVDTYWVTEQLMLERAQQGLTNDDAFLKFMLHQIRLNYFRTEKLDKRIQESIFVLTCDIMKKYFSGEDRIYQKNLQRALKTYDYGMYRICCYLSDM